MHHRCWLWLTAAALVFAAARAEAQRAVTLDYSQLQMPNASRGNEIEADLTNTVWFTTDAGVTAIQGDQQAPGFPLNINDFLGNSAFVSDVTFGELTDGENFFLGFPFNGPPSTFEYGRVLDDRSVSINAAVAVPEELRRLASDGTDNLTCESEPAPETTRDEP